MRLTYIQHLIIDAIKQMPNYAFSDEGYTTSIDALCNALPGHSREVIIAAIIEIDGVQLVDSPDGAIKFPPSYFT